jgi:hypothetical protein
MSRAPRTPSAHTDTHTEFNLHRASWDAETKADSKDSFEKFLVNLLLDGPVASFSPHAAKTGALNFCVQMR